MKPMLGPERDLEGATPETLARALFRRTGPLRSRTRRSEWKTSFGTPRIGVDKDA